MDFLSALIIIGIAQGFYTLSLLLVKREPGNRPALYFILIILFLIWIQAEFLSIRWPYDVGSDLFYGTRYGSWLLLGPLFYLYVLSIEGRRLTFYQTFHFVPFLITFLIIPLVYRVELSFYQVDYGMLNVFNPFKVEYSFLQLFYSWVFVLQFVHLGFYLLFSLSELARYERSLRSNFSDNSIYNVKWVKRFSYYLLGAMVLVVAFAFILFKTNIYRRATDYIYVLPMAFIMYAASYKLSGISWPSVIVKAEGKKYEKSSLTSEQRKQFLDRLNTYVKEERPYLNNGLRLIDLSDALNIPSHHLSQVINESLRKSFFDYINEKRVEEAKNLIANNDDSNLLEIAFRCGFNNKNSFTNAFKKYTGSTPSSFKQKYHLSKN